MTPEQVETHLHLWPALAGGTATLINLSENHTFRIDAADGLSHIIRVHRPGYQTEAAINSELAWLNALRNETDLPTITPLAGTDGKYTQKLGENATRQPVFAVRFAFEQGTEPTEKRAFGQLFSQLGELAAICHHHVTQWTLPKGFTRSNWTTNTILDADGLWGNWRAAPGVTSDVGETLSRLDKKLRADFETYGRSTDRFGLIHADMRLANILSHHGQPRLIDFDDCGFGWFAYDFGAAVSFFENDPQVPELQAAWLEGYRRRRAFSKQDEAMLPAAVMLRRMALQAWIGSHNETDLAKSQGVEFAQTTLVMAERYLSQGES